MFVVWMFRVIAYLTVSQFFFFFNDTATTEIYTLSLHDALPICRPGPRRVASGDGSAQCSPACWPARSDRKSTRLNSSHLVISYAVFCLKKKKNIKITLLVQENFKLPVSL